MRCVGHDWTGGRLQNVRDTRRQRPMTFANVEHFRLGSVASVCHVRKDLREMMFWYHSFRHLTWLFHFVALACVCLMEFERWFHKITIAFHTRWIELYVCVFDINRILMATDGCHSTTVMRADSGGMWFGCRGNSKSSEIRKFFWYIQLMHRNLICQTVRHRTKVNESYFVNWTEQYSVAFYWSNTICQLNRDAMSLSDKLWIGMRDEASFIFYYIFADAG